MMGMLAYICCSSFGFGSVTLVDGVEVLKVLLRYTENKDRVFSIRSLNAILDVQ